MRGVHGGTKAPPYNQPDEVGLHRGATSSTKWTSSAKRISLRTPTDAPSYRVRSVHGGTKAPPYGANAYRVQSLS
ncbi:MAG: hypothetical protein IJY01_04480, partial [Clostridia bacterium]|nr:hypothetical protein [Clostridia bacterium]